MYHIQSQSIVYKTTNTSVMQLVYETFLTHVLLALYFGDTEVQGQNFRDLFLKLFHVCFMHFQILQTFSMATVCRMFKVSFTEVLPMFVSCIWNTQGTGG